MRLNFEELPCMANFKIDISNWTANWGWILRTSWSSMSQTKPTMDHMLSKNRAKRPISLSNRNCEETRTRRLAAALRFHKLWGKSWFMSAIKSASQAKRTTKWQSMGKKERIWIWRHTLSQANCVNKISRAALAEIWKCWVTNRTRCTCMEKSTPVAA